VYSHSEFFQRLKIVLQELSGLPRYQGLAQSIRQMVDSGALKPGFALPSERELAETLGVSRVTVRSAIAELVEQRVLSRKHGARTVVSAKIAKPLSTLSSFSEDILSRGMDPGARWISKQRLRASPHEAMKLALSSDDMVWRLKRLRTADGIPIAFEEAVVPERYLPSAEQVDTSLYEVLEKSGHLPHRALQRMWADVADSTLAKLLEIDPGSAVLNSERLCFDSSNNPIELTRTCYRGGSYDFFVELHRSLG
jgi:GntR family transcriptional regulator